MDKKSYTLPTGSYEITDINDCIQTIIPKEISFSLTANNNTLQSIINCSHEVNLKPKDSISKLLGFKKVTLAANATHTSSTPVKILKFNVLRIECSITRGSYINDKKVHTIHEFFPAVPPGFEIIEVQKKLFISR